MLNILLRCIYIYIVLVDRDPVDILRNRVSHRSAIGLMLVGSLFTIGTVPNVYIYTYTFMWQFFISLSMIIRYPFNHFIEEGRNLQQEYII